MPNIKSLTSIIPLAIILLGLVSYNFIGAQWTPAPPSPPGGNVDAPINVGRPGVSQSVTGAFILNPSSGVEGGELTLGGSPGYSATALDQYVGNFRIHTDGTEDMIVFRDGRIGADRYCDVAGNNCTTSAGMGGGGLGYGQSWQYVDRSQGVWYQNNTPRPIEVFHKNIMNGTLVYIGVNPWSYTDLNFVDYDSDLDNGSTFVVPPGHWYYFGTPTGNSANGYYVVRELR